MQDNIPFSIKHQYTVFNSISVRIILFTMSHMNINSLMKCPCGCLKLTGHLIIIIMCIDVLIIFKLNKSMMFLKSVSNREIIVISVLTKIIVVMIFAVKIGSTQDMLIHTQSFWISGFSIFD